MTAQMEISLERLSNVIDRWATPVHRTFRIHSTSLRTLTSAHEHDETQPIPRMIVTLLEG